MVAEIKEMAVNSIESWTSIQGALVVEGPQDLSTICNSFLPLIKSHKWIIKAKELVMKHPQRSQIISKRLGLTDFAVAYVIYDSGKKTCKYINQNDLKAWHMNETDLRSLSLQNLRRLFQSTFPNSERYLVETQTGLCYFDGLGNFSASVLLLHEVADEISNANQDQVYQIPKNDLLLGAKTTDAMATCVMGDVSMRFTGLKSFLGLQPLTYRNGWVPYEHNKVGHQFPVPLNKDEIKIYRKAIFK